MVVRIAQRRSDQRERVCVDLAIPKDQLLDACVLVEHLAQLEHLVLGSKVAVAQVEYFQHREVRYHLRQEAQVSEAPVRQRYLPTVSLVVEQLHVTDGVVFLQLFEEGLLCAAVNGFLLNNHALNVSVHFQLLVELRRLLPSQLFRAEVHTCDFFENAHEFGDELNALARGDILYVQFESSTRLKLAEALIVRFRNFTGCRSCPFRLGIDRGVVRVVQQMIQFRVLQGAI